jgi:hypothetical protein
MRRAAPIFRYREQRRSVVVETGIAGGVFGFPRKSAKNSVHGTGFTSANSVAMSEEVAVRFRKQAEEAKAVSPLDKKAWLRVAEEWLKLALSAERRRE